MEQENILPKLRDLGLNTYETRLWVSLLSRGISTVGELSDAGNVPRSRGYDVLESLRKKGFVSKKQNKPAKYEAIPPVKVIEKIKQRINEVAKDKLKLIEELKTKDSFKELESVYEKETKPKLNNFAGSFRDKKNTKKQIQQMIRSAKSYICINETSGGLKANIGFLTKALPSLEKKGVDLRVMASVGEDFAGKYGNIKMKNTKLPNRFYIVDGKEMFFMLFDEYDAGILATTKSFIRSVAGMFNKKWNSCDFID